ncbi:uncharacterized protein PHACADRAFT_196984 [Phanerochaete carnosa HHB-10118-sp]|uniref:tRNA (guanine(10)-N(2))-methyltransferase n=1 Tax=Phanerochaete carnosa (strain HHB-10118-sp) TaxID=650164 RepID=K5VSR6_PHACS|nr:uncharacterized protein PHACADRAFT_196984 [Phanerochaete carnosa HHB-10118-sp]EKM54553.1 hypothetical protein PHACADRAFT_196984 [Phanerochaete carnosa HHB-10118-sp]
MITDYLFVFAQKHDEFRVPEVLSVAELYDIKIAFYGIPAELDVSRPFMVLGLESEEDAKKLARKCILIKSVHEFYGRGKTYEDLFAQTQQNGHRWAKYVQETSFKFKVEAYNHSIPQYRQKEVVESFAWMDFLGEINMRNPEITLCVFEECEDPDKHGTTRHKHEGDGSFVEIFFGRLIEEGSARKLVQTFDVKKRTYYGNTSMEAEISLLMANQTLASPGKLVYDPFIGTGSMAYTSAYFGAYVYGSDIDGRQMRGKDKTPGIMRAAAQYGVQQRIIDLCTFDVTRNPWRCGELFDAIVTDPPYGVRAGAKRLGRKNPLTRPSQQYATNRQDDQPYIPPTKPYELSALATDLVLLARHMLKPGGRLVFFLPTVTDEYAELDLQTLLCVGMEVIANSLQDFGSWGRRLITIKKTTSDKFPPPTFDTMPFIAATETSAHIPATETSAHIPATETSAHIPAHKDFREKYFQGFKKGEMTDILHVAGKHSPDVLRS